MEDKRVFLLYGILICAVLTLSIGIISLTLSNTNNKEGKEKTEPTSRISTKTRRPTTSKQSTTVSGEDVTTTTTVVTSEVPTTSVTDPVWTTGTTRLTSSSTAKTTAKTTTKKVTTTTKKNTTTTKKTTTKKTTTQTVLPPSGNRQTTESSTTYPLAQDDIEWEIFNLINKYRAKNGLSAVKVAVDFRRWAEEAADYIYDFGEEGAREYLYDLGLNNYRRWTNHILTVDQAISSLYTATIQNTPILTDGTIRYVGIGVIFRQVGHGDLPTYYYAFIYE